MSDCHELFQERSSQNETVHRFEVGHFEHQEFGPDVITFLKGNLEVNSLEGVLKGSKWLEGGE